jgi:hypothetical protein
MCAHFAAGQQPMTDSCPRGHNYLTFSLWTELDGGNENPAPLAAFTALVTSSCRNADGARRPRVEMAPCKSASRSNKQLRTWGAWDWISSAARWDGLRPLMKRESLSGCRFGILRVRLVQPSSNRRLRQLSRRHAVVSRLSREPPAPPASDQGQRYSIRGEGRQGLRAWAAS